MRICVFSAQYYPHMGGVERYTDNLIHTLVKRGHNVTLVTSLLPGTKCKEEIDGYTIIRLPSKIIMNGRYPILYPSRYLKKLNKYIKGNKIDLIFINTRFYLLSVYAAKIGFKNNVKTIILDHGSSHMTTHSKIGDFLEQLIEHTLTILDKHYCKSYYGVSVESSKWLEHFNIKSLGEIHNGITLDNFIYAKPTINFREKYGIKADDILISFTGRMLKEKGIYQLIYALKKLEKEYANVYLMLAGEGDELNNASSYADNHIIFLNRIDFNNIVGLMNESDIFCLPSVSEGFCTSLLEAAACKTLIISTRVGGAIELIKDDSYGYLLENNNEQTVYKALKFAVNNKNLISNQVQKTYDNLIKNYTWDKTVEKIESITNK